MAASDRLQAADPLTPRQEEVLRLIARGYTNPQIAEALGVSLDGAKWHVREIMSKLGVDSRDEAAEWWRRESRPLRRLQRAVRAVTGSLALRIAAGGVVIAVVASIGIAALLAAGSGEPSESSPSAATTGPTSTEGPTAAATFSPSNALDDIPLRTWTITAPAPVPAGVVLYPVDRLLGL